MKVEKELEIEIVKSTAEADSVRYAQKRMKRIVMNSNEQELYCMSPGDATDNVRPGYPCADYE